MIRKHELFPTYNEIQADPSLARSDHLPILASVPLTQNQYLNIISLNILGSESCSGVHPYQMEIPKNHTNERYEKIAIGLSKAIELHKVSVLFLQEASDEIIAFLNQYLPKEWEIIKDEYGIISCFDKSQLTLKETSTNKTSRIRSIQLFDTISKKTIEVHNLWGNYSPFPNYMEEEYRSLLTKKQSDIAILIGDTNSRIAPVGSEILNIITGLIPPMILNMMGISTSIQVPDHPDGGFYCDENKTIHQLEINTLDFDKGTIVHDTRNEQETEAWNEFRMIMCLDEYYQTTPIISDMTIFEYEKLLQKEFNSQAILVRMASDSYNHKALAVRFPSNLKGLYLSFEKYFKDDIEFQFRAIDSTDARDSLKTYYCLFVPKDKIELFNNCIEKISQKTKAQITIEVLDEEINRLTISHWYFRDATDKINSLKELKRELSENLLADNLTIIDIYNKWKQKPLANNSLNTNLSNNDLIGLHRNIFFSANRPGVKTRTQTNIENLMKDLNPFAIK